jgi:hypothetical protein
MAIWSARRATASFRGAGYEDGVAKHRVMKTEQQLCTGTDRRTVCKPHCVKIRTVYLCAARPYFRPFILPVRKVKKKNSLCA